MIVTEDNKGRVWAGSEKIGKLERDPNNPRRWSFTPHRGDPTNRTWSSRELAVHEYMKKTKGLNRTEYEVQVRSKAEMRVVDRKEYEKVICEDAKFLLDVGTWPGNVPGRLRGSPSKDAVVAILLKNGMDSYANMINPPRAKAEAP